MIPDDLIPLAEAARLLPSRKPGKRLNTSTLYRWLSSGRIQGYRIGSVWFVRRADVLALAVLSEVRPEVASQAERRRAIEEARKVFRGG